VVQHNYSSDVQLPLPSILRAFLLSDAGVCQDETIFHFYTSACQLVSGMPELPEVEVLVRHLRPLVCGRRISGVEVLRTRVVRPTAVEELRSKLRGATFSGLKRRGKYLVFELKAGRNQSLLQLVGHLGMTGRMYLAGKSKARPKHAAVVLNLGRQNLVFEDTRYFGRLTFDTTALKRLGPEPLEGTFTLESFAQNLKRSRQAIKIKLLDQALVAGVGNIYASEALFQAGISPKLSSRRLNLNQVRRLREAIRNILSRAIESGSTVPLNYEAIKGTDGLFYFGRAPGATGSYQERFLVYDRAGLPCWNCGCAIRRIVQAARSTFYCPKCQCR
jgi:formamidopyrimidine-DNA glycosylase